MEASLWSHDSAVSSSYLFFMSRTSLLRVISSACCDDGLCMEPGDAAITMLCRLELGERSW